MSEVSTGTDIFKYLDLLVKAAAIFMGSYWTYREIKKYSLDHRWIQFDIDANLFKLPTAIKTNSWTWDKKSKKYIEYSGPHTHVVEFVLKLSNKGKTKVKIYNIQVGVFTMKTNEWGEVKESDGHLSLKNIYHSGNVVPDEKVEDKETTIFKKNYLSLKRILKGEKKKIKEKKDFHYYIEPNVDQTITCLALIKELKNLLQVKGEFSLEQERIFPLNKTGKMGLRPHTAVRTFQIDPEGNLIK